MNPTNDQLKAALAKMLPEDLYQPKGDTDICWSNAAEGCHKDRRGYYVLDTELLHICWMIEETLTKRECQDYTQGMNWEETPNTPPYDYVWHATWQQRTIALAKVKGIEI